jgi:hypothetical protein
MYKFCPLDLYAQYSMMVLVKELIIKPQQEIRGRTQEEVLLQQFWIQFIFIKSPILKYILCSLKIHINYFLLKPLINYFQF